MKIGIVCPYDLDRPGGVQQHIRDLAKTLRERGHRVKIIAPPGKQRAEADVLALGHSRCISFNQTQMDVSWASRSDVQSLLDQQDFDLLHFHTLWDPAMPYQLFRAAGCARVATFHDTPPDTFSGRLTRYLFRLMGRYLLARLDAAIAVSSSPARHLLPPRERSLHLLPPCVDLEPFQSANEPFSEFVDERLNLLFLGRLDVRKGVFVLVKAFRRLCNDGLPVRLLIVGDGDDFNALQEQTRDEHHIKLIGAVPEQDKARWYATGDIFCAPSPHGESFGIVLVEAMASGLPVVAAANAGYRSVLGEHADQLLAEAGNADDLYEKLKALVQTQSLRREFAAWGRKAVMQYDCREIGASIETLYNKAVEHHKETAAVR